MCRSKISIHIDVRYKKSYTVKKVSEVAAGMKNKILVIEDDRAISELLCMNLEAAGYETVAAYDGEEAQRLLLCRRTRTWQWWISCCREKTGLH